jgi:hypothetical protein
MTGHERLLPPAPLAGLSRERGTEVVVIPPPTRSLLTLVSPWLVETDGRWSNSARDGRAA